MPAVAVLAAVGMAVTGAGAPAHAAPPPAPETVPAAPAAKDVQVTLITGDQVTLHGGDPAKASIEPGAGRQKVGFNTYRVKDHSYVIPSDVAKAVGDGRLDRRLFDVTGLIKDGYDDASSSSIPVLATYQGTAKRSVLKGATITRQLPVIGGAALKVDKKNATAFLGTTIVRTARSASGFAKVWLDGRRALTLDQSVPQIGGPVAWQAGYTGKDVPVAVLDTGIDVTHPDLATQVAGEQNFTTEPADDLVGHGTHVASTIAGTGAASDGKYKGVAPDARLYDGKVCEVEGCAESAILAGMEWAANEVKAKVVNLSIGGTDTPEIDPLEEAVNRLTAETGTLFVVASGNEGPADGTVASPGSADAALTVGAVDKQDHLADFSSRGPRVGDAALKPDVTAPGVDIVAAKSKDSSIGEPVGDRYLRLSGTSMATPHVAGSAAILLQEHPSWTPAEVKGALMASAAVMADQTSFQQGAGRIDVGVAINQTVIAEPGSVSFGIAAYPHDDDVPVTKDVTLRNLGDASVTLNLTSSLNGPDGTAAPAGALSLSANTLTVPAGGTASVQVTSNTKHSGPDGLYSGQVAATGAGQSIVVPVGVEKQGETYTLTVSTIRPDGSPAADYPIHLSGIDDGRQEDYADQSGTVKIRVPKGEYLLDQWQDFEQSNGTWGYYKLLAPSIKLTSDQTVVLDARKAKEVTTRVPDTDAELALAEVGYDRIAPDGRQVISSAQLSLDETERSFTLSTGPALPADQMIGHVMSQWGVAGEDGRFTNTPYLYGTANYQPGEFVTGFDRTVHQEDLAVVDQTVHATTDKQVRTEINPVLPGAGSGWATVLYLDAPRTVRFYLDEVPGSWYTFMAEARTLTSSLGWNFAGADTHYEAGRTYHERWNVASFVPAVHHAARTGNDLEIVVSGYADADGHYGGVRTDSATSTLYRDGEEVASSTSFGSILASDLPADEASYKLISSRTQTATGFSQRIDLTATFTSASTAGKSVLPVRTVRYQPKVDEHNMVKRSPVTELPVVLQGTPGATLPSVATLQIQVSGDNGSTWRPAAVVPSGAGYKAIFPTPAGPSVSLKSHVVDTAGNSNDQTVIGAYPLR